MRRVGDDRHPPRGCGDDLLAQERAAAALDEPQFGIDLVRAVDRQIEFRKLVQRRQRDAARFRLGRRRLRRRHAADVETGRDFVADEIDEVARGCARAEAEPHAGLDESERALRRFPLPPFAVRARRHGLRSPFFRPPGAANTHAEFELAEQDVALASGAVEGKRTRERSPGPYVRAAAITSS